MGEPSASPALRAGVGILDVLRVELCARAQLDLVPVADLVRSERVCTRWQAAVHHYLGNSTLAFKCEPDGLYFDPYLQDDHRTITIDCEQYSLQLVSKIMEKWGHYIKKVMMVLDEDTRIDIIVSKCPNLVQIEIVFCLKQMFIKLPWLTKNRSSDSVLAELFQNKSYESISIHRNSDLTGEFLKCITSNNLKTLNLMGCDSLTISGLLFAVHNLRSLTCLELHDNHSLMLKNVGLLLKKMSQLKVLRLTYNCNRFPFIKEFIEVFSGLVNLRRLTMRGSGSGVNDAFLEVLARACPELEYLEVHEPNNNVTARGVAALCHRSPLAVTTLDFSGFKNASDVMIDSFLSILKHAPLYQELEALGCLVLTPEGLKGAIGNSCGGRIALHLGPGGSAPRDGLLDPGGNAPQSANLDKELKLCIW